MVEEPIHHSFVPELHPSYYLMHKYWARKPHNIVRTYIEHYTKPGDVVLDPFSGSGVTAIESLLIDRKSVAVDINPIACLITESTLVEIDPRAVLMAFNRLHDRLKPYISTLYQTSCNECASVASVTHAVWERTSNCPVCGETLGLATTPKLRSKYCCPKCDTCNRITSRTIRNERMTEVWYACDACGVRGKKPATVEDGILAQISVEDYSVPDGIRNGKMFSSNRTLIYDDTTVTSFFTARNHLVLSLIIAEIRSIHEEPIRRLFEFIFTSSLAQASRLIPYRDGLSSGGPAWTVSGFWIPNLHFELNAWNCFANRFKKVTKGKQELDKKFKQQKLHREILRDKFLPEANLTIINRSCTNLDGYVPDESIDYIFTDPPYGDSIPYLEYSTIWSGWLGYDVDFENEVVVSNSSDRNKSTENYRQLIRAAFGECYRVLKPGCWLSVTFHNRDMEIWDAIVVAAADAGFNFVNCLYQVPAVVSAKAQLSRTGSTTGDIILNFRKPLTEVTKHTDLASHEIDDLIVSEASQVIGERGGAASTDEILRGVVILLLKNRSVGVPTQRILQILQSHFTSDKGMWRFLPEDVDKVSQYEQLETQVTDIIAKCLAEGRSSYKEALAVVLSSLLDGRTPDLKLVLRIYDQLQGAEKRSSQLSLF